MNLSHLDSLLACAVETAQAAGNHALDHYNRRAEVVSRSAHVVKLQLDLECQDIAFQEIRRWYPKHTWMGEEGGQADPDAEICWVVDPIDGTVNFSHGLPLWCCSVAALHRGQAVAGAVFLPMLQERFTATVNDPARCNDSAIRVSDTAALAESAVGASALETSGDDGHPLRVYRELLPACQKIRMLGSAAIHLCYVAAGRLDGYVETLIHLWDCAAGGLIVNRAGGRMEILEQPDAIRMRLLASNGGIHREFLGVVRKGLGDAAGSGVPLPTPWDRARSPAPSS